MLYRQVAAKSVSRDVGFVTDSVGSASATLSAHSDVTLSAAVSAFVTAVSSVTPHHKMSTNTNTAIDLFSPVRECEWPHVSAIYRVLFSLWFVGHLCGLLSWSENCVFLAHNSRNVTEIATNFVQLFAQEEVEFLLWL